MLRMSQFTLVTTLASGHHVVGLRGTTPGDNLIITRENLMKVLLNLETPPGGGSRLVYNSDTSGPQWYATLVYTSLANAVAGQANQIIGERVIIFATPATSDCGTYSVNALTGNVSDYTKISDRTDTGAEVGLDSAGFSGNLTPAVDNVQALADAVDQLGVLSRKFVTLIEGDDLETTFVVEHSLGENWPNVQVWDVAEREAVTVDVKSIDANNISITFITAPALGAEYRVIVIG